ncbi:WD40-repeat-containing domain protein [Annulohypoxylon maeteangense]|uniref:WD40-repeat-containing domain protein n=1 Tax=Annulohypoxylon maeteangense TaxID=1927788 RepID=UPI002007AF13|nr:WD40-repeat-containing domain protein [Annulohypoxylon maeteangense]KAI0880949.1 WD40-repeat-containing domain protein [Annulohypoxylon maeteangense]
METQGRSIPPLRSLTLDLPPSCIEFCPGQPEYFVVGTYNLQRGSEDPGTVAGVDEETDQQATKSVQTRDGSLILFKLTGADEIQLVQTVPYPSAILDLHFHPGREGCTVLAVVSSTGTLSFFRLSSSEGSQISLKEIITHRPLDVEEGILFLSCSWHPHIPELLAITTSDYQVHIIQVDDFWNVHQTSTEPVITHTLEAWTVAFSPLKPRDFQQLTIFSGGDDSKLFARKYAFNPKRICGEDDSIETLYSPISIRGHEAGVTAILPLDIQFDSLNSVVITGSYDDHIRVFAIYDNDVILSNAGLLAEENLQGGVWRLKLIDLQKTIREKEGDRWTALILASCMHAGSRILEITGETETRSCDIKVLGRFEEHKSMNYGSDFQPGSEKGGRKLRCISTSFYDRLLCLWEY